MLGEGKQGKGERTILVNRMAQLQISSASFLNADRDVL